MKTGEREKMVQLLVKKSKITMQKLKRSKLFHICSTRSTNFTKKMESSSKYDTLIYKDQMEAELLKLLMKLKFKPILQKNKQRK